MNHQQSKFRLCCLPTQYGKTFVAMRKVQEHLAEDSSLGKSLHIVVTMDNLLNNSQTALRFSTALPDSKVAVLSSKKMGKKFFHTSKLSLLKDFLDSSSSQVVVTCNNRFRVPHIMDLVSWVQAKEVVGSSFRRVFLYFDELHKYINTGRGIIEQLCALAVVHEIVGLSATPYSIWSKGLKEPTDLKESMWDSIQMLSIPDNKGSISSDYMGARHSDFRCITHEEVPSYTEEKDGDGEEGEKEEEPEDTCVIDYIRHVLTENPDILSPSAFIFAPADITCYSHIFVRLMIFELCPQIVIVLLNGGEKSVSFSDEKGVNKTVSLSPSLEISDGICSILKANNIDRERPILITGCLCLGMGQTLINQELGRFTTAILGKTDTINDDMYQLYGRITGRNRRETNGTNEINTVVYSTQEMQDTCVMMESMAENLMTQFNGLIATRDDYLQPLLVEDSYMLDNMERAMKKKNKKAKKDPLDKGSQIFETQEEAIAFAKVHFERPFKFQRRKTDTAARQFQKHGENLTEERIMKSLPGINEKTPVLMVPTYEKKWIVFWRPSLIRERDTAEYRDVYESDFNFEGTNPICSN